MVFRDQVRTIEGAVDSALCRDALGRIMRGSGSCAVAVPRNQDPDNPAGWVVSVEGGAVYVYVRSFFRRQGIGTALLRHVRPTGLVGVAYWTADAVEGAAHGLPVEHSLAAYAALLSFKRGIIE
jgi:GNAT superfamily N-acetyltransferase